MALIKVFYGLDGFFITEIVFFSDQKSFTVCPFLSRSYQILCFSNKFLRIKHIYTHKTFDFLGNKNRYSVIKKPPQPIAQKKTMTKTLPVPRLQLATKIKRAYQEVQTSCNQHQISSKQEKGKINTFYEPTPK